MSQAMSTAVTYQLNGALLSLTSGSLISHVGDQTTPGEYVASGVLGTDTQSKNAPSLDANRLAYVNPVTDYLLYIVSAKDPQAAITEITNFYNRYNQPDTLFYPDPDQPNHWYFLVQLSIALDKTQIKALAPTLFDPSATGIQLASVIRPMRNVPFTKSIKSLPANATVFFKKITGQALTVSDDWLTNHPSGAQASKKANQTVMHRSITDTQLQAGLTAYMQDPYNLSHLSDDDYRQGLWLSIVDAIDQGLLTVAQTELIIDTLSQGHDDLKQQYQAELQAMMDQVKQKPRLLKTATPFGDYVSLYQAPDDGSGVPVINLADQMRNILDDDFEADPEMKLPDAGAIISTIYPPALLKQAGDDRDNVVIFDPLRGLWEHDENLFYMLLSVVKPFSPLFQLDTMLRTFAADARSHNRYVTPYSGSRYLLFRNGAFDTVTNTLLPLDSSLVKSLHFTERSKLEIDYVDNPPLPTFEHSRILDGGTWTPKDFINAYANNEPDKLQFFLFGLSLGLFGGHNFGVNFDIVGSSRWGKTQLSGIFDALYDHRIQRITYSTINSRFPFDNYKSDTGVIWFSEANAGASPLNDDYGTIMYDSLADGQVHFQVKGRSDIILDNPPQVYLDGTEVVRANNLSTGPAGRTLVYKLPTMTEALQTQSYGVKIKELIANTQVLQWLVHQMIQAYQSIIPENQRDDFTLLLAIKAHRKLLPEIANTWRQELLTDNSDLAQWFTEQIEPFLADTADIVDASLMHDQVFYWFYDSYYINLHPYDEYRSRIKSFSTFQRELHQLFDQNHWKAVPAGSKGTKDKTLRKKVSHLRDLKFDTTDYEQSYRMPEKLDKATLPAPFKNKQAGWYNLVRLPHDE